MPELNVATLTELAEAVQASDRELKGLIAKQSAEVKQTGETLAETKAAIAAAEKRADDAHVEFVKRADEADKERAEVVARVSELEKSAKRYGGYGEPPAEKSIGQRFVECMQERDEFSRLRDGKNKSSDFVLKGFGDSPVFRGAKSLLTTDATRFAAPFRDAVVPLIQRRLRLRDLLQSQTIGTNSVEYVEMTAMGPAVATGNMTSISHVAGVATATTAADHGLRVGDRIYISGADQAGYNIVGTVRTTPTLATFTYKVAAATVSPATGTITWFNMSSGAAAGVSEGSVKPQAQLKPELKTMNIQSIAHWISASRQVLDDVQGLAQMIDNNLMYGVLRKEEQQILYGTGTAPQLQGIMTHGSAWNYAGLAADTKLDAFRRALTFVYLSDLEPSGGALSPEAWEDIELAKGNDGQYMLINAPGGFGGSQVWRMPVVVTPAMLPDDFLVGAFALGGKLYDREQANIRFTDAHDTTFIYNLLTILAEERVGVAWLRPDGFVIGNFDAAV